MSPQLLGMFLALNATGILLANGLNARLVRRFSPRALLDLGLGGVAALGVLARIMARRENPKRHDLTPSR